MTELSTEMELTIRKLQSQIVAIQTITGISMQNIFKTIDELKSIHDVLEDELISLITRNERNE